MCSFEGLPHSTSGLITYGGPSITADILKSILTTREETIKDLAEMDASAPSPDWEKHLSQIMQWRRANTLTALRAEYRIGKYILALANAARVPLGEVTTALCNKASQEEFTRYVCRVQQCANDACTACQRELASLSSRLPLSQRSPPCRSVQIFTKLDHTQYTDLSPTHLEALATLAQQVPEESALLRYLPTHSHSTATLRSAVSVAVSHSSLLSPSQVGLTATFATSNPIGALNYVDGDGGFILTSAFRGLGDFLQGHNLSDLETPRGVPFREWGHDTPEVGHMYIHQNGRVEMGVECLRKARSHLAGAKKVVIHTTGKKDLTGRRLLVAVDFVHEDGSSTCNGEALLSLGLSHPTTGEASAPHSYQVVAAQAQSQLVGIYRICNGAVPAQLLPWNLRQSLAISREVSIDTSAGTIKVAKGGQNRFEGNIMVLQSNIPGAGLGCFIAGSPGSFIPTGSRLTIYASSSISEEEADNLPSFDYLLMRETAGRLEFFNADDYNGINTGRFVNQGGLEESIRELARQCALGQIHLRQVENIAEAHCLASFRTIQGQLLCTIKERAQLTEVPKELTIHYGIQSFWLPYLSTTAVHTWGKSHVLIQALAWTVLPHNHATWSQATLRDSIFTNFREHWGQNFDREVQLPWPELLHSKRRRT